MNAGLMPTARPRSPLVALARGAHIDQVVEGGFCIGCGACAVASSGKLSMEFTLWGMYTPVASDGGKRLEPTDFAALCPFGENALSEDEIAAEVFPDAPQQHEAVGRWRQIYVGHVESGNFRTVGSSGGFTSWLLAAAFAQGEIDAVVHVGPHTPTAGVPQFFQYGISRQAEEIQKRAKSRYYPIEFSQALAQVRATPGRYAFVGIPCFVKAVRLLMRQDPILRERIVLCVGLFCGHLKSAALVRSFARQARVDPAQVEAVDFRLKQPQYKASRYTVDLQLRGGGRAVRDWSRMFDGDWGMGYFQYSACDYCDDVMAETADVSCGDAWLEPYTSDGRGTNIVVIRSPMAERLVQAGMASGELEFAPVDADFAARTQAAGLRQRREGLSYRLWKLRRRWHPPKRVEAKKSHLTPARQRIYDCRQLITRYSHRIFRLSEWVKVPLVYWGWAWAMRKIYHHLQRSASKSASEKR